jgi:hypothetical protein
MKRNWDTVREILVMLEEKKNHKEPIQSENFSEDRLEEISYHMELVLEAGLVEGEMIRVMLPGPTPFMVFRLTWSGHEFLDSIRNDTLWNKIKTKVAEAGLNATVEWIKIAAIEIGKGMILGG